MLTRLAFFSYSNEYAFVALALYALELLYQKDNKWLFPIASALLVQSFDAIRAILYFLLFAVYTIFRCYVDGEGVKLGFVVKQTLKVMGLQLLGYGLVAVLVLRDISTSWCPTVWKPSAARGEQIGRTCQRQRDSNELLRSFSNEIMGSSVTYTGRNTYVCGPAFVIGAMNVLIFPQIFVKTTNKKRVWYFLAICAIGAYIFIAPLRLLMNGFAYDRFKLSSFWITIIMLYFGAIVWDRFFREGVFNKSLFLLTGGGVLAALLGLTLTDIRPIDTTAAWITIAIVAASMLAVLMYNKRKTALFAVLMIAVIAVDLVVNSFTSVDHRQTLTMDEYKASYLASGIEELAESFKQSENDFFRISNYDSSYSELHCDGQANNYLSATTYDGGSGVSNEYNRFAALVGGNLLNQFGYRTFANDDFTSMLPIQTLLGVRYRVFDQRTMPTAPVVPYGYTLSEQDGYWVLKNENALPLALAFDSVISESDLAAMSQIERRESLLANAMVTDNSPLLSAGLTVTSQPERHLDAILNEHAIPLTQETEALTLDDETEIVRQTSTLERAIDSDYAVVRIDLNSSYNSNEGETYRIYWAGEDGVFTQENSMWYSMPPGQNQILLELPIRGTKYLRIDVEWLKDSVEFASVSEVSEAYFANYVKNVNDLKEDAFTFTRLDNKRIEGTITTAAPRVLCFTFLSERGWSATVNGKPVDLELIDGGFMGVLLGAGENQVTLSYHVPYLGVYAGVTAAAAALYSLLCVLNARGKKKKGNAA